MTTDTAATLALMDAARIGPHITCPVSRHAAMVAEAMMRGEPYVMMDEDRVHCGASIGDTVASLWEARAEIERLREALRPFAAAADDYCDPAYDDDYSPQWAEFFVVRDFRRARAAIAQKEGE